MRRGDGKGEGGGGGVGGSEGGGHGGGGEGGESSGGGDGGDEGGGGEAGRLEARAAAAGRPTRGWRAACVPGDASAKCARSKDSGNGGDLWVMLEECSVCFGKRKEERGRL